MDCGPKKKGEGEGSEEGRGRGTETEEWLGVQFGAVTQESSETLPPSLLPNTTRVQENGAELVRLATVAQSEGPRRPGTLTSAPLSFSFSVPLPRPKRGSGLLK